MKEMTRPVKSGFDFEKGDNYNKLSDFADAIYKHKYSLDGLEQWEDTAYRVTKNVLGALNYSDNDLEFEVILRLITERKFIPGGRYLYAAGRDLHQVNNCFLVRAEDSREGWGELLKKAALVLQTGGGIGVDYSDIRGAGTPIKRTGGIASGPLPLMQMVNEIGRGVMQGGSRRSAIIALLRWDHPDCMDFIHIKDWLPEVHALKEKDFNFPATLDMTNISVQLNDEFFEAFENDSHPKYELARSIYAEAVRNMLATGEPGFSIDTGENAGETLRNPCSEITSADDSDVCCLGSINLGKINSIEEFDEAVEYGTLFLMAGTVYSDLPYDKVGEIREKNRRIGLGLMGIHEWLLKRGYSYGPEEELAEWLETYRNSDFWAEAWARRHNLSVPVKTRAIAPTGTIAIIGETTTGIEPIFCLTPESRILTTDFDWVRIDSLKEGDKVIGFREEPLDLRTNKFESSEVLSTEKILQPTYRITTDKGVVEASENHLWVGREILPMSGQANKGQGFKWISTKNLKPGMNIGFTTQPWERDESFDGGWLSGILDGEGFLGEAMPRHGVRMSICQNEGPVLNKIKRLLEERGIEYTETSLNRGTGKKIEPLGKWMAFKLLGMTKPSRLMPKALKVLESSKLCGKYSLPATVLSVEYLGDREVIALETSTHTLIAEGFLSHNCVAYKRRFLKNKTWHYQYVIDPTAKRLIDQGVDPNDIEDAYSLSLDVERRVAFQAWVQSYVDHAISSTINLPFPITDDAEVNSFGKMLYKYLPNLRGVTCYPDGARGGQPLVPVPYSVAINQVGVTIEEEQDRCVGGSCGT